MNGQTKIVAALLALFAGSLGIHKFYLGRHRWGVIYILFCWSGVPSLIGGIEGILYLIWSEEKFKEKNGETFLEWFVLLFSPLILLSILVLL